MGYLVGEATRVAMVAEEDRVKKLSKATKASRSEEYPEFKAKCEQDCVAMYFCDCVIYGDIVKRGGLEEGTS